MSPALSIHSSHGVYPVFLLKQEKELLQHLIGLPQAIVVIDSVLADLHPALTHALAAQFPLHTFDATEETKTFEGVSPILDFLQRHQASRQTTVIAIGGGITQDAVSFAAHIFHRGLSFIYVPSTALAMCDSCIGAKCGLNYKGAKNQIGAFHPPTQVIIWPGFLDTLRDEDIYSGYGEIVKLFLTDDLEAYQALKQVLQTEGFRNTRMAEHIIQSLTIKKSFIEADEFDTGIRRLLNYGHTFGHALEQVTAYAIAHGIAVARGIDIVNYIAYRRGWLNEALYVDIHHFIETHFACGFQPLVSIDALMSSVKKDKKVNQGLLNLVVLKSSGELALEPIRMDAMLHQHLEDYFKMNVVLYKNVVSEFA